MPELKIKYMNIKDLIPYENNPRINDDAVKYVALSIKDFGFKNPIIIDKNNVIIAGHTRLLAAKELKLDKVPVITADDLTEEQTKALRIADNRVSEFSEWDTKLLQEELAELPIEFEELYFPEIEVEEMLSEKLTEKNDNQITETFKLSKENLEFFYKNNDDTADMTVKVTYND